MRNVVVIILAACFFAGLTFHAGAGAEESLVRALADMGFSDIGVIDHGDSLSVTFEPFNHRDTYMAYTRFKNTLLMRNRTWKAARLCMRVDGVPYLTARITRDGAESFPSKFQWPDSGATSLSRYHRRRFQMLIGIPFKAAFGNIMDPFIFRTGIGTMFRFRVHDSVTAFANLEWYVHNEYDPSEWYSPAQIGVEHVFAGGERSLFVTTAGVFPRYELYGVDMVAHHYFRYYRNLYIQLLLGGYGKARFNDGRFYYGDMKRCKSLVRFGWLWDEYGANLSVTGGRYMYGDYGVGSDITRTFGLVSIGVGGSYSDDEFVGRISVSLPLGFSDDHMLDAYGIGFARHQKYTYSFDLRDAPLRERNGKYGYNPTLGLRFNDNLQYYNPAQFSFRGSRRMLRGQLQ